MSGEGLLLAQKMPHMRKVRRNRKTSLRGRDYRC